MNVFDFDIKEIEKENWKKAEGVKYHKGETNSALAPRDYSINCRCERRIAVIKGYFIWWCSRHHQPMAHCRAAKLEIKLDGLKQVVKDANKILEE